MCNGSHAVMFLSSIMTRGEQSHQEHNNGRKKVFQKDITLTTQDMAESRINFPAISSWFQTRAILKTLFKQRPVPFRSLSPFQTKSNYV